VEATAIVQLSVDLKGELALSPSSHHTMVSLKLRERCSAARSSVAVQLELCRAAAVEALESLVIKYDTKTLSLGAWFFASILLFYSNHYIFVIYGYESPYTLCMWQAAFTTIVTRLTALQLRLGGRARDERGPSWSVYLGSILPLGMLIGAGQAGAVMAAGFLPPVSFSSFVSFLPSSRAVPQFPLRLIGSFAPMLAAAISYGVLRKEGPSSRWWQLVVISGALALGCFGLKTQPWYGVGSASDSLEQTSMLVGVLGAGLLLAATGAECTAYALIERLLRPRHGGDSLTPALVLYHYAPVSFFVLMVAALAGESGGLGSLADVPAFALLLNGFAGLLVAFSIPCVVDATNSVTLVAAGPFLLSLLSSLPVGLYNTSGFLVSLLAFNSYLGSDDSGTTGGHKVTSIFDHGDDVEDGEDASRSMDHDWPDQVKERPSWFLLLVLVVLFAAAAVQDGTQAVAGALLSSKQVVLDFSRTATIIEPRNIPHLAPLLIHFLAVLPPAWPMTVFCSPENVEVLRHSPSLARQIDTGRLNLTVLPHTVDLHDGEYLSRFLTKPWFWEQLSAEWLLFFQSDSMICGKSEQSIEDWVGFDWVGAPWTSAEGAHGGNGGFSMRKRSSMLALTRNVTIARIDNTEPEDVWFSQKLEGLPGVKWPTQHQGRFSVEQQFDEMNEWAYSPLGMHSGGIAPSLWHSKSKMARLTAWCPEIKLFLDELEMINGD
jgi:hypothetical protein